MSTRESYTGAHVNSLAPHYAPYSKLNRRDSNHPTAIAPVGQREGRLSERSPAVRSWAAQAGFHSPVQGDRLSHSFYQSLIDIAAVTFWFLFIALVGLSITTAILILMFVVSF